MNGPRAAKPLKKAAKFFGVIHKKLNLKHSIEKGY